MEIELKGIHRVRVKLASGATQTYFYAWRGGPRLNGPDGRPLTDPSAAKFRAAYDALQRLPFPKPKEMTVHDLVVRYKASSDYPKSASSIRNYGMALDDRGGFRRHGNRLPGIARDTRRHAGVARRDGEHATPAPTMRGWC